MKKIKTISAAKLRNDTLGIATTPVVVELTMLDGTTRRLPIANVNRRTQGKKEILILQVNLQEVQQHAE